MKYLIGIAIAGFVLYHSVYFRPLDEKLTEGQEVEFDPKAFVEELWEDGFLTVYDSSIILGQLLDRLEAEAEATFEQEGKALGIGSIGYFKVKGEGEVIRVNEDDIIVDLGERTIALETEFVFGNAIRDASGLIQLNDYDRTADFNSISEAINAKIRAEVIPGFRASVKVGDRVRFQGALELNKAYLKLQDVEIIPIVLQITS